MRSRERFYFSKYECIVFVVIAILIVTLLQNFFYQTSRPTLDSLRYIDYALNIHDHQVFGLSGTDRDKIPAPGNANSPLYPTLIAFAIVLDSKLSLSLKCVVTDTAAATNCPNQYSLIVGLQNVLVIVTLICLWLTTMLLFQRSSIAWLAAGLALASTKPISLANYLLPTVLILCLFSMLMLALVGAWKSGHRHWALGIGVIMGLLTLTRAEYIYLAYSFVVFGIGISFVLGWKRTRSANAIFILALCVVIGPWLMRNHHHFDRLSITEGYSDVVIAYRSAYNRMSLSEWAAAFVYWLPRHGETLAAKLLPQSTYRKLGTDQASYLYTDGIEIFEHGLAAINGDRDRLTRYLIQTEILTQPFKHAFVGIPLAWRGILTGRYLAVLGVPCLLILAVIAFRHRDWGVPLLLFPPFIMVVLYAMVSVSIPRYNVYLINYYAIAVAWIAVKLIDRVRSNYSTTTVAMERSAHS